MGIKSLSFNLLLLVVFFSCKPDQEKPVTDPKIEKLRLADGFAAEHLYSPSEQNAGSWVAMTFDDKGRMITSDQYGALYRFNIPAVGDTTPLAIQKIVIENKHPKDSLSKSALDIGFAQGLLYAFNSLYVVVNHAGDSVLEKSSGVYRLEDSDGNDQFDKITLLKLMKGSGEHGPHSLKLAPDKKSIFIVAGNYTDLPEMNAYRLPRVWKEDNLFPEIKDPRGHAADRTVPGGWIANFDPEGKRWELYSAGFRNTFDITFNEHGELFAYDSDMEWDLGMPWYRPTRICHVTSGSDFGWRTGNGPLPPYFEDNLPPVVNIGQGSPTNFVSGMDSNFPEKYRTSLFASDWSFGIIYAVHLEPSGATYTATVDEFLSGAPLPLTDGMFGPDGAFYFLTGGRRLQSDLYRVYYKGETKNVESKDIYDLKPVNEIVSLRRELEQYHGALDKSALQKVWSHLGHSDRFVRYAARVAVEHQPVSEWRNRVFDEKNPLILAEAAIALAHHCVPADKDKVLEALSSVDYRNMQEEEQCAFLRAVELVIVRMGVPSGQVRTNLIQHLDANFPSTNNKINRFLAKLLIRLEAPSAVDKTLALMISAKDDPEEKFVISSADLIMRNAQYGLDIANMLSNIPPREQIYHAIVLSKATKGWDAPKREKYFAWFREAFKYKGGNSYIGFINNARLMALQNVPEKERGHYDQASGNDLLAGMNDLKGLPQTIGEWHEWKVETASAVVKDGLTKRNFENGKNMFAAVLCRNCHSLRGEGGSIGPDLTQIGTRFSTEDIITHIILPNKEVSDQYAPYVFEMKEGKSIVGKLVNDDATNYYVSQNPFTPDVLITIPKKSVISHKLSRVSLMPPGLLNRLSEDELKDLLAYMVSGGDPQNAAFK